MNMQLQMNGVLSGLGINGSCVRAEAHRHLAFFDIQLNRKQSSLRILENSAKEIALHMKTKTIPIMKIVPEEGVVRMQVALKTATPVDLKSLWNGIRFPKNMIFPFLLGEDDGGEKLWMDMNDNPHLLIAGSTGSGKSTLIHNLICNSLFVHGMGQRNIEIYLSDPKRVEFVEYAHYSINGIVKSISNTYEDTLTQLKYIANEMERRYYVMHSSKIRSISENTKLFNLILYIIDEVADLKMQDKSKELQNLLVKIAQKGRAAGIFLVLATQRPSVDIITGIIKANFPGRIACKTASRKDSEVVLDRMGAETLLGRGDAILQNMKYNSVRFQVAYTVPSKTIKDYQRLIRKTLRP
jgi:S-DNA-T family DNA segregation ATPase FtsK/SpoIIIE